MVGRREFIDDLKKRLRKLPYDEIKEAVDYYEEYFDDAGADNEMVVLGELGSPSSIAAQIIASFAVKGTGSEKSVKRNWHSAWLVIISLLASPAAVPVAIAVGAVALAVVIAMSAVVLALFLVGIVLFGGGIMYVIVGIVVIAQSVPTTLFMLGSGLVLMGAGTTVVIVTSALSRKCFSWLAKQVGSFILRRNAE